MAVWATIDDTQGQKQPSRVILIGTCLLIAFIARARPEVFADGPPSWQLFLSLRGTAVIGFLGLIGIFFLNLSSLRGLWDSDLSAWQKVLIPAVVGMVLGVVSIAIRRFTPVDAVLERAAAELRR